MLKNLSPMLTISSEEVQSSRYIIFSKLMSIFNLEKIASKVFSFVSESIFFAAKLTWIKLPFKLNAKTPSAKWSKIVSNLFFSLEISFILLFIWPIITLNVSTSLEIS